MASKDRIAFCKGLLILFISRIGSSLNHITPISQIQRGIPAVKSRASHVDHIAFLLHAKNTFQLYEYLRGIHSTWSYLLLLLSRAPGRCIRRIGEDQGSQYKGKPCVEKRIHALSRLRQRKGSHRNGPGSPLLFIGTRLCQIIFWVQSWALNLGPDGKWGLFGRCRIPSNIVRRHTAKPVIDYTLPLFCFWQSLITILTLLNVLKHGSNGLSWGACDRYFTSWPWQTPLPFRMWGCPPPRWTSQTGRSCRPVHVPLLNWYKSLSLRSNTIAKLRIWDASQDHVSIHRRTWPVRTIRNCKVRIRCYSQSEAVIHPVW